MYRPRTGLSDHLSPNSSRCRTRSAMMGASIFSAFAVVLRTPRVASFAIVLDRQR